MTRLPAADRLRVTRFVVVGIGAAGLMFLLSLLFRSLGFAASVATITAYAIVFAVAYLLQRGWTFGASHGHRHALPRYFLVQVVCAAASGFVGHVTADVLGAPPVMMAAAVTVTAGAASYVLSSRWVFADRAGTNRIA